MMVPTALPKGPWQDLFRQALLLMEDIKRHGHSKPFWTFGGGTVLMLRYEHRLSKDIDLFVPDPQYLGYVTPRLSDVAASITEDYDEASQYVKLFLPEGEIDIVASPNLTENPYEDWMLLEHPVKVESAAEIVAKKMWHRGDRPTPRDLFDLCCVIDHEPDSLRKAAPFLLRHRGIFLDELTAHATQLSRRFDDIRTLNYRPSYDECVEKAKNFLNSLALPP